MWVSFLSLIFYDSTRMNEVLIMCKWGNLYTLINNISKSTICAAFLPQPRPSSYLAHKFPRQPRPGHLPPFTFYDSSTNSFSSDTVVSLVYPSAPFCHRACAIALPSCTVHSLSYRQGLVSLLVLLLQALSYQGCLPELFVVKKKITLSLLFFSLPSLVGFLTIQTLTHIVI